MNKLATCRFLEVYGFSASSGLLATNSPILLTNLENVAFSATLYENPSSQLRHIDTHCTQASGSLTTLTCRSTARANSSGVASTRISSLNSDRLGW